MKSNLPQEIKEKIKSFLLGLTTTQNEINKGFLNQEGIDYICEKATNHILELFQAQKQEIIEIIEEKKKELYNDTRFYEDEDFYKMLIDLQTKIKESK